MIATRDLYARAVEMHKAGRPDAAFALFAKVVARDPAHSGALSWLVYLHNHRGEYDRAVAVEVRPRIQTSA